MRRWTYAEIKAKIEDEADLKDELFITDDELLSYVNEAIDEAEADIHKLGREDHYFLASASLPLVQGTKTYSLPSDIYANKIKNIVSSASNKIYSFKRLRREAMFEEMAHIDQHPNQGQLYSYIIKHESVADGYQLEIYPTPYEDSSDITIWYIRNANELSADTDICDIPEFVHFVIAYALYKCFFKEGHPKFMMAQQHMEKQRQQMINTLTQMVVDSDNKIEMDMSHYLDSEYYQGES